MPCKQRMPAAYPESKYCAQKRLAQASKLAETGTTDHLWHSHACATKDSSLKSQSSLIPRQTTISSFQWTAGQSCTGRLRRNYCWAKYNETWYTQDRCLFETQSRSFSSNFKQNGLSASAIQREIHSAAERFVSAKSVNMKCFFPNIQKIAWNQQVNAVGARKVRVLFLARHAMRKIPKQAKNPKNKTWKKLF